MKWAEIAFSGSFFITPSHRIIMFLWWLTNESRKHRFTVDNSSFSEIDMSLMLVIVGRGPQWDIHKKRLLVKKHNPITICIYPVK